MFLHLLDTFFRILKLRLNVFGTLGTTSQPWLGLSLQKRAPNSFFKAGSLSTSVACIALIGCTDGLMPQPQAPLFVTPLMTSAIAPEVIEDPSRDLPEADREDFKPIFAAVEERPRDLLRRPDAEPFLRRIGLAYLSAGRYWTLMDIYEKDVAERGVESPAAPHLAWGYIRLGQERRAQDLLQKLRSANPQAALPWFLWGVYYLEEASSSEEAATYLAAAWQQAVDLNPGFVGYENIDASAMRAQIGKLRQSHNLSDDALQEARLAIESGTAPN